MNIHALTVCVNYQDFLCVGAERWAKHLASWTIITDSKDDVTARYAESLGVGCFRTDVFYEHGANFNKGAALESARRALPQWEDWFLLLDADVVPEPEWFKVLCDAKPEPEKIYGAWRYQSVNLTDYDNLNLRKIRDGVCDGGYFQLFHTSDSHIAHLNPVIETDWSHAGVYDSHLKKNWPEDARAVLPVRLTHLGPQENWHGRGNREAFVKMNHERMRTGRYDHERIKRHES
jgi:hypothetical protein